MSNLGVVRDLGQGGVSTPYQHPGHAHVWLCSCFIGVVAWVLLCRCLEIIFTCGESKITLKKSRKKSEKEILVIHISHLTLSVYADVNQLAKRPLYS
jgi:hypothetical protein